MPCSSLFYKAQEGMAAEIEALAYRPCAKQHQLVRNTHTLAFDGSWAHARWSLQCFAALIDLDLRWIIDFDVIDGSSDEDRASMRAQTLESKCLVHFSRRWRKFEGIGFTHDQDAKATRILAEQRWIVRERFDRNHVMRSYYKLWNQFAFITPDPHKRRKRVLGKWIELSLVKHFQFVAKLQEDLRSRLARWRGAVAHYLQSVWPEKGNAVALVQLQAFIEKAEPLMEKYQTGCSTQLNESLHSLKAKMASKQYSWKYSVRTRNAVAVITWNEGQSWKMQAYDSWREKYGWPPLGKHARSVLEAAFRRSEEQREERRDPAAQMKANMTRRIRKHKQIAAPAPEGLAGYGDDDEGFVVARTAPGESGIWDALPGFITPEGCGFLGALLSGLLSLAPLARALKDSDVAEGLIAALRRLIVAVEHGEEEIEVDDVMESLMLQAPAEEGDGFFREWQDPSEAYQALCDGLYELGASIFMPILGIVLDTSDDSVASVDTSDVAVMPFARLTSAAALDDLRAGYVRSIAASGAVRRWPQVLPISIESFERADRRIDMPRTLSVPDGHESLAWYGLAALIMAHPLPDGNLVHYTALVADAKGDGFDFIHFNDQALERVRVEPESDGESIGGEWRMAFYLRDLFT
jgi:hypothetical protein